jgi:hypothetical protein
MRHPYQGYSVAFYSGAKRRLSLYTNNALKTNERNSLMQAKAKAQKREAGTVRARLTKDERTRVVEHARARGITVSKWVRDTLLEALDTSPTERRLTTFVAAQTLGIRLAMEEWQQGQDISKPDVRERIERLATEAARQFAARLKQVATKSGGAA